MNAIASGEIHPAAAHAHPEPGPGIANLVVRSILRSLEIRRRRRMLQEMPDFLLKDIGINRSEIDSIIERLVDERADATRRSRGAV